MSASLDMELRLKELESILGQPIFLAKPAEEEPECLPEHKREHEEPGVVQKQEGETFSSKDTIDRTTPQDAFTLPDSEELDEMGNYADSVPFSQLKAQDLSDENIPFCPWKLVKSYADCYTGKGNRERVRPFFNDALNIRDWNFFYIRDTRDSKKAHLLVPTRQLQNFLGFINRSLSTQLTVPRGAPGRSFYLRFPGCGPFRPRYLLHHARAARADAITAAATSSGFDMEDPCTWPKDDDANENALKRLETDAGALLNANMALLRRDPTERARMTAGERQKQRQEQRNKEMQAIFRHLQLKDGVIEKESDVVFFCVDVEALETAPNQISEIGVAVLDMQRVRDESPGKRGRDWWPMIEAHHLRIKEYAGLVNYRYVQGCPDHFQFGESTFPSRSEAREAVRAILRPYLDQKRRIVIAGHDVRQDVNYLGHIGFDLKHETRCAGTVDSQVLYQVWQKTDTSRSLSTVLDELGFEYSYLHNAGNDAVQTLRAVIGVTFAATEAESPA